VYGGSAACLQRKAKTPAEKSSRALEMEALRKEGAEARERAEGAEANVLDLRQEAEALQQELQVAVSRIQVTESALRTAEEAYELLQKESERRLLQSEEMLSDLSTRAGSPLKSTPLAAAVEEERPRRADPVGGVREGM